MKSNTLGLPQETSQSAVPSGLSSYAIIMCCLLVLLAYILGYTTGRYHPGKVMTSDNCQTTGAKHTAAAGSGMSPKVRQRLPELRPPA